MSTPSVILMPSQLTPQQSAELLITSIALSLEALEKVSEEAPLSLEAIDKLDEVDTRTSLLLARLRCRRSIVHPVSQFGRAP